MDEVISDILLWLLWLLAVLLLLWLYSRVASRWQQQKQDVIVGKSPPASESSQSSAQAEAVTPTEDSSWDYPPDDDTSYADIDRLVRENPELVRDMMQALGAGRDRGEEWSPTTADLERLADSLGNSLVDILTSAGKGLPVEIDLQSGTKLLPSNGGGVYHAWEKLTSMDDLPSMDMAEYGYPDALRRYRLASGQANRRQSYHLARVERILYFLRDRSGSMLYPMQSGISRDDWARGVMIHYARKAAAGKVRFMSRGFTSELRGLDEVMDPAQARRFMKHVWETPALQSGGTDIMVALRGACADIASLPGLKDADIVLVSDGESYLDVEEAKALLAKDGTRLHVIMIGLENPLLKSVATSYQVIE
jgi:hypothetical protein